MRIPNVWPAEQKCGEPKDTCQLGAGIESRGSPGGLSPYRVGSALTSGSWHQK